MPHELERFRQLLLDLGRERGDALAVEGANERFTYKQLLAEVWLRAKALSAQPRACWPLRWITALNCCSGTWRRWSRSEPA